MNRILGMKCKHPHLADAELAKLSLQLQISCDICNKLPVMRGTAHPQRNSQLNVLPASDLNSLWIQDMYFPAQEEAKHLRSKHSRSLWDCGLNPWAPHWSGLWSPLKCLQYTGQANTERRGGPGPYTLTASPLTLGWKQTGRCSQQPPLRKQTDAKNHCSMPGLGPGSEGIWGATGKRARLWGKRSWISNASFVLFVRCAALDKILHPSEPQFLSR